MDRFFHVTEKGSTVRTEIMAGITTFMAMAYILMVNAGMFSNPFGDGTDVLGVSYGAIYVATAISAVVGTLLIGLLSNLPLAQASGMGLNAYFVYTVCVGLGLSYANALVLVLFDGIIFVLLTVTGLRKIIFDSIPHEVKVAISAGIGLFIAFIGLQNAGIVVNDASTCVNLHSFNVFTGEQTWATIFPMLITLIAVFAIGAMSKKKVRGAVLWGILGAAVVYYAVGLITVPGFYASAVAPNLTSDFFGAFRDFGTQAFAAVFKSGFDFSAFIAANGTGAFVVMLLTTMLAFCMVDMFDTLGTLYGACSAGNMLDPQHGPCHAGRRLRYLRGLRLRHLHRHHLRGVLRRCGRGRPHGSGLHGHGRDVLHRHVPVPGGSADPHLCLRRGPDLCGRSDDVQRPQHQLGRSRRRRHRLCHRGLHAPDLQHFLRYCLRPDLLRFREDLHRQDQGYQRGHLDHQHPVRPDVLPDPVKLTAKNSGASAPEFFSNRKLPPPAAEGVFCVFVRRERKSHKEWFLCTGKRIPCKHGEIMKST